MWTDLRRKTLVWHSRNDKTNEQEPDKTISKKKRHQDSKAHKNVDLRIQSGVLGSQRPRKQNAQQRKVQLAAVLPCQQRRQLLPV